MICPLILDLRITRHASRIVTFFGMIPNFEPKQILPKLASLVRPKDFLLFSANLAPGKDYAAGVKKVLPQYDNPLTRDWLMTFLLDLGMERNDGKLRFKIETDSASGLKRIVAGFHFTRSRRIEVESEAFDFRPAKPSGFSFRIVTRRSVFAKFLPATAWKFANNGSRNRRKRACFFAVVGADVWRRSVLSKAARSCSLALRPVKKLSSYPARP